jgi:hypothetical protein
MNAFSIGSLLSLLAFWANPVTCQQLTVSSDRLNVNPNTVFELEFLLENENADHLIIPDIKPFTIISGPSTSTQIQIINGRKSQRRTWLYQLKAPSKSGNYILSGFSVRTSNRLISANPIRIEVNEVSKQTHDGVPEDGIMIRMEAERETLYIGEAMQVQLWVYTNRDIASMELSAFPEFRDCYVEDMTAPGHVSEEITIKGRRYIKRLLKRITIFPQRSGTIVVDPVLLTAFISEEDKPMGVFSIFRNNLKPIQLQSNNLKLNVKELPSPLPEHFIGASGVFNIKSLKSSSTIHQDEVFSFQISISGEGDIKRITAPKIELQSGLEMYEVKLIREDYSENVGRLVGQKTFEYTLVPTKNGRMVIEQPISYFDIEKKNFKTVVISEELNVLASDPIQEIERDRSSTSIYESEKVKDNVKLVSSGIVLSAVMLFLFLYLRKRKYEQDDTDLRTAERQISKLEKLIVAGKISEFYLELQRQVYRWGGQKLEQDPGLLKREDLYRLIEEQPFEDEKKKQLKTILQTIDMHLYAKQESSVAATQLFEQYKHLIESGLFIG